MLRYVDDVMVMQNQFLENILVYFVIIIFKLILQLLTTYFGQY